MRTPRRTALAALILALSGLAPALGAQTIFVDTARDDVDFGGAHQVADLPGPDGRISLREAGMASDNTVGVQTIGFHVPQSEWDYQWLFPGRAVLKPFLGLSLFDTVILDARTQTAFTGDTHLEGGEVVIWHETYLLDNVGAGFYGFDNSSIHLVGGSANFIQGNTNSGIEVFDSFDNLIGGTLPGEGNTGGTIEIDRAHDNVVIGNTVLRVRVLGWAAGGQAAANNRIGGPTPAERNVIMGQGTWNSEGVPGGFAVQIFDATGTLIENNQIGMTPDGLQQGHLATTLGVSLDGENYDTVIRNNRIAGILGHGIGPHYTGKNGVAISVYGEGAGVTIVGNTIGLDANDQPLLPSTNGIAMVNYYRGPVRDVLIGGPGAGEGNEIAGMLDAAIGVAHTFSGVRIAGNSLHDNQGIGIDLITPLFQTGVTPNDPLDLDSGGNGLQNFPVITEAFRSGGGATARGTLDSAPNRAYRIELFANSSCDASGHGEGELFLGAVNLNTDAAGSGSFSLTSALPVPAGWTLTATAADLLSGDSSEFSACAPLSDALSLTVSPLQRGQTANLSAVNAQFQESVIFLASARGLGAGVCPPVLGGLCVDLLAPVMNLGSAVANAAGTATLQLNVPPGAPLITMHFQAVVRRGPGGAASVKSGAVSAPVLP